VLASALALALGACGGGGDGPPPAPSAVAQADVGVALGGTVGAEVATPVRVRVTATDGRAVRGTVVTWTPGGGGQVSPATSTTDGDGIAQTRWTLGGTSGVQTLGVAAGNPAVRTQLFATAAPGRPAAVRVEGDTVLGLVPGLTIQLRAQVTDRFGNTVPGAAVSWRTGDSTVATIDATGRLIARATGATTVEATSDTARARLSVRVDAQSALALTRVSPETLVPGGEVVIEGAGFVPTGGNTEVLVAGVRATLLDVTPTRIRAAVPGAAALPCQTSAGAALTVRRDLGGGLVDSARRAVTLPVATRRTLGVGESVALLSADAARCTQLDAAGRYLVTVFNTDARFGAGDFFAAAQLRGVGAAPAATPAAARLVAPAPARPDPALTAAEQRAVAAERAHGERMAWERALVRRAGSPLPGLRAERARGEAGGPRVIGRARRPARALAPGAAPAAQSAVAQAPAAGAPPAAGDTVALSVFNLNARSVSCGRSIPVRARVVHVGARSVVYEDVTNSQAGTMDAVYRQVADEFDTEMFLALERNFGDPLAMDARLDRDGKIAMLFSRVLNDSMPNILGYVISCNYYPRSAAGFSGSNEMELFYARAPLPGESATEWRHNLRATTIHELKHVTAFGEKIARAGGGIPNYEEEWLEEGSARVAEEIYARRFSGAAWRGNAGYAATVGCELTRCDDRPRAVEKHWTRMHVYYRGISRLSPLVGNNDGNATYYSSAWSILRWAVDHYAGQDEAAFLRALTLEPRLAGVANLAARTGRPPAEMLADWGLAVYADDAPGAAPRRAQLAFPSWNQRDILRGVSTFNPLGYPGAFPLPVQTLGAGDFLGPDLTLRGWTTAYFELSAPAGAPQLLELRAPGGGAAAGTVGVAILRVE
jgi:hypothetical protein